jgi:hypothetical protein
MEGSNTYSLHPFEFLAQAAPTEKHPFLASPRAPLVNPEPVLEDGQSRPRVEEALHQIYRQPEQGLSINSRLLQIGYD